MIDAFDGVGIPPDFCTQAFLTIALMRYATMACW